MWFSGCKNALKYVCGRGLAPDCWVSLQHSPDPQTLLGELTALPRPPRCITGAYFYARGRKGEEAFPKQKFTTTPLGMKLFRCSVYCQTVQPQTFSSIYSAAVVYLG